MMKTISGIYVLSLLVLMSCSHSSLKQNVGKDYEFLKIDAPFKISLEFHPLGKGAKHDVVLREEQFQNGLNWGQGIRRSGQKPRFIFTREKTKCNIDVTYETDDHSFSSWKTWVSGLTLFIVPIKFKSIYKVQINSEKDQITKIYNIETWMSLFLIPAFPFTTFESTNVKKIGSEIAEITFKHCQVIE